MCVCELTFITSNKHKFEEAKKYLGNIKWLKIDYPEIQGNSNEEIVKASLKYLENKLQRNFFIEDSGLYIEALNGFPGPYSKYVYNKIGCEGILKLMEHFTNKNAEFISTIGAKLDNKHLVIIGKCKGKISHTMQGIYGFGYDPIFIPNKLNKTFAELTLEIKNKYSHRGKALKKLKNYIL